MTAATPLHRKRRWSPSARREALAFYIAISPWLIGFLVFMLYPMLRSLYLSFTSYDLFTDPKWIGMGNYSTMIDDDMFWHSLKITFIYTAISVPGNTIIGIGIAMLLAQKVRGVNYWRTIYFLPSIASGVSVAVLWSFVFNPDFGLFNTFLAWIGIDGPGWLTSTKWALPSLIIMSWWQIGQAMVIYLAGLKGISKSLYEAAEIDGAGAWRKFINITIPMLSPTILFNVVMALIFSFQVFTPALVMTDGGPANATFVYVLYLYRNAFQWLRMGYASALAWILFIIVVVISLLFLRSSTAWVYYESQRR